MHTQAQIRDSYRKLPDDLREIVGSPELSIVTDKISESFGLNETQQKSLRDIVCFIIMGIEPKSLIKEAAIRDLSVNEKEATEICERVNNEILDNLDHIHSLITEEDTDQEKTNIQIDTPETQQKIKEIGQKYSLSTDQMQKLEYSLRMGVINNLAEEMGVSDILATQIMGELESRILKPATQKQSENNSEIMSRSTTLEIAPDALPVVETPKMEEERRGALEKVRVPVPRYTIPENLPGAHVVSENKEKVEISTPTQPELSRTFTAQQTQKAPIIPPQPVNRPEPLKNTFVIPG